MPTLSGGMEISMKRHLLNTLCILTVLSLLLPCLGSIVSGAEENITETDKQEVSAINTHEVMPDTWVFTDGLGRESLTNADVGDPREDKTVSMFFWTWHYGRPEVKNINELASQYPEAIRDYDHPIWEPSYFQGSWNEPIYGHYESTDQWVLRRQAELLANAGVDAILTDNTNGTFTHKTGYDALFETWSKAMDDGVQTPKVSFMLPFVEGEDTNIQIREMYQDFYRDGKYQDLWFYWESKPVLMAHQNSITTDDDIGNEIKDFFTWRGGYAGYINGKPELGDWGWLSVYPQAVYYATSEDKENNIVEQTTVGVSQNHNYKTHSLAAMSGDYITGRSYTLDNPTLYFDEGTNASKWGYNFSEQFKYALEIDPKIIFITGWNEWAMARIDGWCGTDNAFCDQFIDEFSRDIEPTKGDLKDHYYYQLVNFVRQYKGVRPIPTPTQQTTINIKNDNTQWEEVGPYYASYIGNTGDREGDGWGDLTYHEYSGRNDIIGAKVARDDDNIYFYVECNEDITPYTDPLWMVLYIDYDQPNQGWESFYLEEQGWESFDYVVNKTSPTADKAVLEKFTGNGYETEKIGEVDYSVNGKYMQIKVPKSMLNIKGYDFTLNFAWTDNVHDEDDAGEFGDSDYIYTKFSGDIMDFYISGDVAPSGRFKFSYVSTTENAIGLGAEASPSVGYCIFTVIGAAVIVVIAVAAVVLSKGKKAHIMIALLLCSTVLLSACGGNGLPAETPEDTDPATEQRSDQITEDGQNAEDTTETKTEEETNVSDKGKYKKYFTLSLDDGITQDLKVIEILKKYDVKCVSFNINTGLYGANWDWVGTAIGDPSIPHLRFTEDELKTGIYNGYEVLVHTLSHPSLKNYDKNVNKIKKEVDKDADNIEKLTDVRPVGMAWPGGDTEYTDTTIELVLENTGIRFARGTTSTYSFKLPEYFMKWLPTCSAIDPQCLTLAQQFIDAECTEDMLFYVWGHAYEFDMNNGAGYETFEKLVKMMSEAEDVVLVTNTEFYNIYKDQIPSWKEAE